MFLTNAYVKDWYECLKLKALRSNWLKSYPCPIFHQRRQLQSNVTAYHPLAFVDVDFDQSFVSEPLYSSAPNVL